MGSGEGLSGLQSAVFEGVSEDALTQLAAQGEVVSFESGHMLFERGQDAEELMILQEGSVELLAPVEIMGVTRLVTMEAKQPGDVVAWSSLVRPYHFTLSARCASRCTFTVFRRDALDRYFETDPLTGYLFMRNLAGVIGRRLQAMHVIWMHDLQAGATGNL